MSRSRAARREVGEAVGSDEDAVACVVAPAAGASTAAVRSRLERRVGAESAWGFSKGKTILSGSYVKLGGLVCSPTFGW